MRVIVQTVPERAANVEYLARHIPQLEVVEDTHHVGGWITYQRILTQAGTEGYLHLEDDITLTRDFLAKADAVISSMNGLVPIQFFTIADGESGPRSARTFNALLCAWIPHGHPPALNNFLSCWRLRDMRTGRHPDRWDSVNIDTSWDTATGEFWRSLGLKFWMHMPSLVQHLPYRSTMGHPSGRQSASFVDPETEGHPYPELFTECA